MTPIWTVINLERNSTDDGVVTAHWVCRGEDGEFSGSTYGSIGFTYDATAPDFVPYDQLTEAQVLQWVFDAMGSETVAAHQEAVQRQIDDAKTPPVLTGTPW